MNYFNDINTKFPIRRNDEQKEYFRKYIIKETKKYNYQSKVETLDKSSNIVIGEVEQAEVVFTAHYDTPASSIIPNLMLPLNKGLGYIQKLLFYIVLAVIALGIAKLIVMTLFNDDNLLFVLYYLLFYFVLMYLTVLCVTNKNNYNDNTSGVASIMSIVCEIKSDKVAFILFDNEEKGLLGSKAYNKKYQDIMKNKLVINLDCVGNGNNFIFIYKEKVSDNKYYSLLKEVFVSNDKYKVIYESDKIGTFNSDNKSFDLSIGVSACTLSKNNIYYTSRIHTNKDNFIDLDNINYITDKMKEFIERM